ncbi:MAG TPA: ankyrin repeat domain-containing protein, partial [Bdellovibrionota bacterium]|nr:ankyrin repeat domain-containing protein [Bdellovibrionota bacterium]
RRRQMGEDPFPPGEWWNRVMEDWGSPLGSVTAVLMAATFYWYVSDGKPRMELRRAAEMGDVAAMEEVLDRGASVDGMDLFDGGVTPLIAAVRAGQVASVKYLLRNGADPNFITPDRMSALSEAGAKMEVRELLVAAGAKDPGQAGRALASDPVRDKH